MKRHGILMMIIAVLATGCASDPNVTMTVVDEHGTPVPDAVLTYSYRPEKIHTETRGEIIAIGWIPIPLHPFEWLGTFAYYGVCYPDDTFEADTDGAIRFHRTESAPTRITVASKSRGIVTTLKSPLPETLVLAQAEPRSETVSEK